MAAPMTQLSNENKEKFKLKLDRLKEYVDARFLIESLGFKVDKETHKEIRGACRVHGGDNISSFRFNKERKTWVCFSHKCHEIYGNDIIGLIKATLRIDFVYAVEYLEQLCGTFNSSFDAIEYKARKEKDEFIRNNLRTKPGPPRKVNEEYLIKSRLLRSNYFNSKGYSDRILDYFEVAGGYTDNYGFLRDIIPIRDTRGNLTAYSLRDIRDGVAEDHKYILTPDFDKDKVLYNLHRIIPTDKQIIVVEGFKSVWKLYEYGIKNVVAVMGSEVTQGQRSLLCSHALSGIVIMFDNDVAGASGAIKAYNELKDKMPVNVIFMMEVDENGKGLDPSDLDKDTALDYLKNFI